jgi:hypothetical protein
VRRRDREIIEIGECTALDGVIEQLQVLRARLTESSEPQVEVRGDDNFGWQLSVSYLRELTAEEAELQGRYSSRVLSCSPRPTNSISMRETGSCRARDVL